jgi:AFG3 family protein
MVAFSIGLLILLGQRSELAGAQEITLQAFLSEVLPEGRVDYLVVSGDRGVVRVYLRHGAEAEGAGSAQQQQDQEGGGGGEGERRARETETADFYFTIGSVEAFEAQLQVAAARAGQVGPAAPRLLYERPPVRHAEVAQSLAWFFLNAAIVFLLWRGLRAAQGGEGPGGLFSIGKSRAQFVESAQVPTRFRDVAGLEEAKQEVLEFVQFLKNPEKYRALGARLPRGALLVGPPGTGKTLLARAVAGEAQVPFLSISGSDFVEMFVGVGPSRVRDLFKRARERAPCIVFIDEIDAVGRSRARGFAINDERENTLNQLLVEMDGFATSPDERPVVVLAGTNRPEILDKALLRPGRFDRQITIDPPDLKGRIDVFRVHLRPLRLAPNIMSPESLQQARVDLRLERERLRRQEQHFQTLLSPVAAVSAVASSSSSSSSSQSQAAQQQAVGESVAKAEEAPAAATTTTEAESEEEAAEVVRWALAERLAALTPGFSGAEIANVCNEAALIAARLEKAAVELEDFHAAIDRTIGGIEKRSRVVAPEERRVVAHHEAGHAVAGWFLQHAAPLLKVSIVPRGVAALGYAQYNPPDQHILTQDQLLDQMCMTLGGRIAEQLCFGRISTGAQDDLQKVTEQAYAQIALYGMSQRLGAVALDPENTDWGMERQHSDRTQRIVDEEVRELVRRAYRRTEELLRTRLELVRKMAEELLQREVLQRDDVIRILGERPFPEPPDWRDYKADLERRLERERERYHRAHLARQQQHHHQQQEQQEPPTAPQAPAPPNNSTAASPPSSSPSPSSSSPSS